MSSRAARAWRHLTSIPITATASGLAIAAFLSVRREFIGRPDEVKRIFVESATPLGRDPSFEGGGLLDLMRALQAV